VQLVELLSRLADDPVDLVRVVEEEPKARADPAAAVVRVVVVAVVQRRDLAGGVLGGKQDRVVEPALQREQTQAATMACQSTAAPVGSTPRCSCLLRGPVKVVRNGRPSVSK
jgi:hypothetical protein